MYNESEGGFFLPHFVKYDPSSRCTKKVISKEFFPVEGHFLSSHNKDSLLAVYCKNQMQAGQEIKAVWHTISNDITLTQ